MSELDIPLAAPHDFANADDANVSAWSINLNFRECVIVLGGTIRCDEAGKGDDDAGTAAQYLSDAAGDLGTDNFQPFGERKVLFDDAGHGHDPEVADDGAPISTLESGVTWDGVGGHTHDDIDAKKLAFAKDNGEQGALKVELHDADIDGTLELDLEGVYGFTEVFLVRAWHRIAGEYRNFGIGGSNYDSTDPSYSMTGFRWKLTGDDNLTLTIYNYLGDGSTDAMTWMVIGK